MRYCGYVEGLVSDFDKGEIMEKEKIQVNYTSDNIGKSLSLGSHKHGIQITIPFDELIKILK